MPLDGAFLSSVASLHSPGMGTEHVALVLYSLVRTVRPRRLLEIGAGKTTPYLLQALADNVADHKAEAVGLAAKTAAYERATRKKRSPSAKMQWADTYPELANPAYYVADYEPALHVFEISEPHAAAILGVVADLGLEHLLRLHRCDFRGESRRLSDSGGAIDFAWLDCGGYEEYLAFFEEYWPLINDDNGVLVMHYTISNPLIGHIVKDLKLKQATTLFNDFELLSFIEPHKFRQNSFTIVRRTAGFRDDLTLVSRALQHL